MAGMSLAQSDLDVYVSNANEVIHMKLVRTERDIDDDSKTFKPEFTHQFFNDSESIFGYIGLKVDVYFTASRLLPYFGISFREVVKPRKSGGVEPDDVLKIIKDKLEINPTTNINQFVSYLAKESTFKPYGEMLHSTVENNNAIKRTFDFYRVDMSCPGFKAYYQYMQTFALWFIDAASYIDIDDERWEYFVVYENIVENGEHRFYFAGYATVYRYYAYPTKIRPRISQMLILPPFQRKGLGVELLQATYNWYVQDPDVLDITVEDPSDNFVRLRDYVDCKNCMKLASFDTQHLMAGFSKEMEEEAQLKLKLCKRQARRVYEILRLSKTNTLNEKEYKEYRLEVKKRLNAPYQRQKLDMEKLKKTLKPEEFKATVNSTSLEQRIEQLDRIYCELESEYKQVIERLLCSQ